jgi:hypothetical protein
MMIHIEDRKHFKFFCCFK